MRNMPSISVLTCSEEEEIFFNLIILKLIMILQNTLNFLIFVFQFIKFIQKLLESFAMSMTDYDIVIA